MKYILKSIRDREEKDRWRDNGMKFCKRKYKRNGRESRNSYTIGRIGLQVAKGWYRVRRNRINWEG